MHKIKYVFKNTNMHFDVNVIKYIKIKQSSKNIFINLIIMSFKYRKMFLSSKGIVIVFNTTSSEMIMSILVQFINLTNESGWIKSKNIYFPFLPTCVLQSFFMKSCLFVCQANTQTWVSKHTCDFEKKYLIFEK